MNYSKDNQIRKYVKGYGFVGFAKNFGSKYGKKFLNKGIQLLTELETQHLNLIKVNMVTY